MSCKSALYAANTNAQTLNIDNTINFGSIVRRYGCNVHLSGGNAIVKGAGYYDIDTNFTFTAGDAGVAIITLYKDGTAIPGAVQSESVTAGSIYNFNIPVIVRSCCDCESTITAVLSGVAGTINNAAISVERI